MLESFPPLEAVLADTVGVLAPLDDVVSVLCERPQPAATINARAGNETANLRDIVSSSMWAPLKRSEQRERPFSRQAGGHNEAVIGLFEKRLNENDLARSCWGAWVVAVSGRTRTLSSDVSSWTRYFDWLRSSFRRLSRRITLRRLA